MTEVAQLNGGYSLDADLKPIFEGKVVLPNAKPIEGDVGAVVLLYRQMHSGQVLLEKGGRRQWDVRFFLDYTQGGALAGTGVVAWSAWSRTTSANGAYRAFGMTFAICEHVKKPGPGANPSRGWYPGRCEKCGLDMSVDSGD